MAGSTWSKNTNFHAFMASKNSNFQMIFNITCLYRAAHSASVLQVSNRHWETIRDRDSWNDASLSWEGSRVWDSRLMFTKQGSRDETSLHPRILQLIGPGLSAAEPCWCKLVACLKRIFVSMAEDIIYRMQTLLCRDPGSWDLRGSAPVKMPADWETVKINNLQKL